MMTKNEIILLPGWLNKKGMYGDDFFIAEIWEEKSDPEKEIPADILVGHSLGGNFALRNWRKNSKTKLILVNPLLPQRSLLIWFLKWLRFGFQEKKPEGKKKISKIDRIWHGIKICFQLLRQDFDKTLAEIPPENLLIIYGEKDIFYCDEKFKKYLQAKNLPTLSVKNAGHDWNEKYSQSIKKYLHQSTT